MVDPNTPEQTPHQPSSSVHGEGSITHDSAADAMRRHGGTESLGRIIHLPGDLNVESSTTAETNDDESKKRVLAEKVGALAANAANIFIDSLSDAGIVPDPNTAELIKSVMVSQGWELGYKGLEVGDPRDFARHADPTIPTRSEQEELEANANTDLLTGLFNRRGFYEAIQGKKVVAVIGGDIRNLKAANDGVGQRHSDGDDLIRQCGESIRSSVRATDVIARFGGDEFVVALIEEPLVDEAAASLDRRSEESNKDITKITNGVISKIHETLESRLRDPRYHRIGRPIQYKDGEGNITEVNVGIDLGMIPAESNDHIDVAIEKAMVNMKKAKKASRQESGSIR